MEIEEFIEFSSKAKKSAEEHNKKIAYIANVEELYGSMTEWLPDDEEDRSYINGENNGWSGDGQ